MIQHLAHCVPKGWKVGYGNLLTYVFESFDISFAEKEPLPLKNAEYMQPIFLENLKMKVVDGYFEVVLEEKEKKPKEVGAPSEGEEEKAVGIIEGVMQDIQENDEEEEKQVEEVTETGGRKKKKSLRLMKKKENTVPICIDITGVQEDLHKIPSTPTSGKYASAGIGFAAFRSPSKVPSEEMKEVKEMLLTVLKEQEQSKLKMEELKKSVLTLDADLKKLVTSTEKGRQSMVKDIVSQISKKLEDLVVDDDQSTDS